MLKNCPNTRLHAGTLSSVIQLVLKTQSDEYVRVPNCGRMLSLFDPGLVEFFRHLKEPKKDTLKREVTPH
jgi:hypothetical protein